jgi:hypothetical protein
LKTLRSREASGTLSDFGGGTRWRKVKGTGRVELINGEIRLAELHWYEAHGIGKKETKIKRLLD